MMREIVKDFLTNVSAWAESQPEIEAVVLVGSYARGTESESSDIDLVLLARHPETYLRDTGWVRNFGKPLREATENWGRVNSLRVWYRGGLEIEFGLTDCDWGSDPTDEGTMSVIRSGFQVLKNSGSSGIYRRFSFSQ